MTTPERAKEPAQSAERPGGAVSGPAPRGTQAPVSNQDLLRVNQEVLRVARALVPSISPEDLVNSQYWQMTRDNFEPIASLLYTNFVLGGRNYGYIDDVFDKLDSDWEDNVAAEFTSMLDEEQLDEFAASYNGRATLTTLYDAMITGDVSDFQRGQAERILTAKTRQMRPEDFLASTKHRPGGGRTLVFPVRDMRITPGYDDAPLMAHLTKDGKVNVRYPTRVMEEDTFAAETATLPFDTFVGDGLDLSPNEIVGIKDYESGGVTQYRPALALIDYSNRVEHSTLGKIGQVAITAATLGAAGPEVGGANLLEEEGGKWAARLALADRVANVVQVVSFFVHENRDWLIEHLGAPGRALVRATDIADSVVAIYGVGRLGHAGFTIARDLRRAASTAKQAAGELPGLDADEISRLGKVEDATEQLAQEMDRASATDLGHAETPATGVPVPVEPEVTPGPLVAPGHAPTPATGVPVPVEPEVTPGPLVAPGHAPTPATGVPVPVSSAPRNARVIQVSTDRSAANYYEKVASAIPQPGVVLEFPDGSRVWRESVGGPIRHEATLGASTGRAGMERAKFSATEHGNLPAGPGYERAHSLGQGTGFESPYGIFYAPREVNQTLQNRGIEAYMRDLAANAAPGETFRVVTSTTAHPRTLRLSGIDYSIVRVSGGRAEEVAAYSIRVTSSAEHPLVTATALRFSSTAAGQATAGRAAVPAVLTNPFRFQY